ncbi:MAG: WG repeat-containing protein [Ferruginibacter sp.]
MKKKNLLLAALLVVAVNSFAQYIDMSLIPYRSGSKWGYASPDKKIVIAPKYNDAAWFSEGYAAVKVGTKYGYINKAGKMVIPAKFTVAKPFRKGYRPKENSQGGDSILFAGASLTADGYEKCIDTRGMVMIKCPAINENSVAENHLPVKTVVTQKTYSLPNNNGLFDKVVDDYKIPGSDETYYIAEKGGMYGVFNSKFDTIVPFQYNAIKTMMSGGNQYLQVMKDGMNGIVTGNGQTLINADNSNLVMISGADKIDYVIVKRNGKTYVKDLKNNDLISGGYADINYDNNGGFILTGDDNTKGFYFMDNKIIAPKYSDVRLINGGKYLMVKTSNGKVGYINEDGDEFFVE